MQGNSSSCEWSYLGWLFSMAGRPLQTHSNFELLWNELGRKSFAQGNKRAYTLTHHPAVLQPKIWACVFSMGSTMTMTTCTQRWRCVHQFFPRRTHHAEDFGYHACPKDLTRSALVFIVFLYGQQEMCSMGVHIS